MQLIPKALVVGGFLPPAAPGQQQISVDRINRIWADLAPTYGYTQLQMAPDGTMAQFLGRTPEDGLTVQPPLVQVRSTVTGTARIAAESAEAIIGSIIRHLSASQIFNLGIRHVYTAPLFDNDARRYVLRQLLRSTEDDLVELAADPERAWGGVKYVIPQPDRQYTLTLEPFQADQMRSVYIDLDAQFPNATDVGSISSRAREAQDYLSTAVNRFLDHRAELQ
jgi:hypothetical protein